MGNKNSKPTVSTSSANPQAMQAYSDLLGQAGIVASTPYTPYTGELTAPVNAQQNLGISGINQYAGYGMPYIQQAAGLAGTAAQPLSASDIQQYFDPYTQSVINATQSQFANQNAQQLQQVKGNAISQGALGGNREAIAEAETTNQQNLAQAPVIAGLYNQGYQNAQQTALAAKNATLGGANLLGNLGVVGQNAGLTGAQAQIGAGTLQQQTQQQQDTAAYQQFLNQLAYPFQTTQWLAGIDSGVGSQMGGTSTTAAPGPSIAGQIGGGLTTGVGLLGATGAFGSAGWLLPALAALASGGTVPHGDGVANAPMTLPETEETLHEQQQQLVKGHRRVHMFPKGTKELNLPEGMRRTVRNGDVFHYDPGKINESDIHGMSDSGRENEMLDLGPYTKDEILHRMRGGEIPLAVVERTPHGTEVRAAAGTHLTAPHQLAAMHRAKSPGNSVRLEDPRETIGARIRGSGGRIQGFADGGAPQQPDGMGQMGVMPYAGARTWVPQVQVPRGQGAPRGGAQGLAPSIFDQASQIGALAKAIQGGGLSTPAPGPSNTDQMEGAGMSADLENPSPFWSGGGVSNRPVRGYAMGGGDPYTDEGAKGWVPTMQIVSGKGAPPPPGSPQKKDDGLGLSGMMGMLNSGKGIDWRGQGSNGLATDTPDNGSGIYTGDATVPGFANSVDLSGMGASAGLGGLGWARGGTVKGYAEGGSPYDSDYFDNEFYQPITHPDVERQILSGPGGPQAGEKAYADAFRKANGVELPVAELPMPRARPAGLAPSIDLPPEIATGLSHPIRVASRSLGYAPSSVNPDDKVDVVEGDRPSPLDTAEWPAGPEGAPRDAYAAGDDTDRARAEVDRITGGLKDHPGLVHSSNGVDWSGKSNLWPSLISAGAAMLASRSPYAGVAIGEGVGEGAKSYQALRMNDQKIAMEAAKLQQEAETNRARLEISTMPYRGFVTEAQRQQLARERLKDTGLLTDEGHPIYRDMNTGKTIDAITNKEIAADAHLTSGMKPFPGKQTDAGNPIMQDKFGNLYDGITKTRLPPDAKVIDAKAIPQTEQSLNVRAEQLALGDVKSALSGMGVGTAAGYNQTKVRELAAQKLKAAGLSDKEIAEYLSAQMQEFSAKGIGLNAEARTAATREANLKIILAATEVAIPEALARSREVTRYAGSFVPLNKLIQNAQVATSDEKMIPFAMANLQLAEHWARAMNPTGVMRESDRDKALHFLETATSQSAYETAVKQLQKQIMNEKTAVENFKKSNGPSAALGKESALTYGQAVKELGGGESSTAAPGSTSPASAPAGNKPEFNGWMDRARQKNPKATDEALRQFYIKTYGNP